MQSLEAPLTAVRGAYAWLSLVSFLSFGASHAWHPREPLGAAPNTAAITILSGGVLRQPLIRPNGVLGALRPDDTLGPWGTWGARRSRGPLRTGLPRVSS